MDKKPVQIILDWDYDTFSVVDDAGDVLAIYDCPPNTTDVIVQGWLWLGKSIEPTLYRRVPGDGCRFRRVQEDTL